MNNIRYSGLLLLTIFASAASSAEPFGFSSLSILNKNAGDDTENDSKSFMAHSTGTFGVVWRASGGTLGLGSKVLFATSSDHGISWSDAQILNADPGIESENESPTVAADGSGKWISVWSSSHSLGGTVGYDSDIMFSRSTDNGISWSNMLPLNSNAAVDATNASDNNPVIATDRSGKWVVVWSFQHLSFFGEPGSDSDLYYSRSVDDGATWSNMTRLDPAAATDRDWEYGPQIKTNGNCTWIIAWMQRKDSDNSAHVQVSRSADDGVTWSSPISVFSGSNISPLVTLECDDNGNWMVAWDSNDNISQTGADYDVFFSKSADDGVTWSVAAPLNSNAAIDSGNDTTPAISADFEGNWVAVWQSLDTLGDQIGSDGDMLISKSTDVGATWSAPAALNSNAAEDSGTDYAPFILNDGSGYWIVAWTSQDSLGNTIGTDPDILYSTSYNLGQTLARPGSWMFY